MLGRLVQTFFIVFQSKNVLMGYWQRWTPVFFDLTKVLPHENNYKWTRGMRSRQIAGFSTPLPPGRIVLYVTFVTKQSDNSL